MLNRQHGTARDVVFPTTGQRLSLRLLNAPDGLKISVVKVTIMQNCISLTCQSTAAASQTDQTPLQPPELQEQQQQQQ
jgi:hypothetical protein